MSINPLDPIQQMMMRIRGITPGIPGVPNPAQRDPYPMDEVPRPNAPSGQIPQVQGQPPMQQQDQGFTPQHAAQDAYNASISNMPQRNKPGKGRRFAGILAGIAGGPSATESIMYSPYHRQMDEWGARNKALGQAAQFENQDNIQARLMQNDINRYDVAGQRVNIAQQNADTSRMRAEVYQKLAQNQGSKVVKDNQAGKQYIVYRDGRKEDLGIGTLSYEDQLELQKAGKLEILGVAAQNAQELEGLRQEGRLSLADFEAKQKRERDEYERANPKPSSSSESESQKKVEIGNRARKLLNDRPELRKLITVEGDVVTVAPEGTGSSWLWGTAGFSPQDRKNIIDHLYEGVAIPDTGKKTPPAPGTTATTKAAPAQAIPPKGKIQVEKDGKKFWLPMEQLQEALKQGYKKVSL